MSVVAAILALGALVALHEAGHMAAARAVGMKVLRFSVGFLWPIASFASRRSGTVYQIGALPLGGFVQVKGMNPFEEGAYEEADSYQRRSGWARAAVVLAGPLANFGAAFVILWALYAVGAPEPADVAGVGRVTPGGPADRAGLEEGDLLRALDGAPLVTWDDLVSRLRSSPGREVELLVERGGARFALRVVPEDRGGVGIIGISQPERIARLPLHLAAVGAFRRSVDVLAGSVSALAGWIAGSAPGVEAMGPVGIVRLTASSLDHGVRQFLAIAAYLSLMLTLFNLLPFPALDGGRLLVLLGEAVTRRRLDRRVDAYVNTGGMLLLLSLFAAITVKELFFG